MTNWYWPNLLRLCNRSQLKLQFELSIKRRYGVNFDKLSFSTRTLISLQNILEIKRYQISISFRKNAILISGYSRFFSFNLKAINSEASLDRLMFLIRIIQFLWIQTLGLSQICSKSLIANNQISSDIDVCLSSSGS